jgi:outer membrane lipoprotein SlyB
MPRLLLLATAALLAACRPDYSPDTYASTAVQQAAKVEQGIVVGVRGVGVAAPGTTGAVAGAAAGGALGATAPQSGGVAATLGAIGGSLIGGIVGTGVERAAGDTTAWEYIVRKTGGDLVSVTQKDATPLAIGERVLVIAGAQARIVPDYTVPVVVNRGTDLPDPPPDDPNTPPEPVAE